MAFPWPWKPPLLLDDDRVSCFYLNVLLPAQLALFLFASGARLSSLFTQRRRRGASLLLNDGPSPKAPPTSAHPALRLAQALCCALLVTEYAVLLAADGDARGAEGLLSPAATHALYVACWACGAAMWLLCLALVLLEHRRARNAGRAVRLWWVLNLGIALLRVESTGARVVALIQDGSEALAPTDVVRLAAFGPELILGLSAIFESDTPSSRAYGGAGSGATGSRRLLEPEGIDKPLRPNAEATASFFSRLTFSWLSSTLASGAKRALEHDELFDLQTTDATVHNAGLLQAAWRREMGRTTKKPSFLAALYGAFGGYFLRTGLLKVINDLFVFVNPLLINVIVTYIASPPATPTLTDAAAFLCAGGMFISATAQSLALGQYFFRGFRLGLNVRVAVGQVVYAKALALPFRERQRFGTGAIVSYMQIDAGKLADALPYLHLVWSAPLQLALALALLYGQLGVSAFAGLGVMVLLMPVNIGIGRKQVKFTRAVMGSRDKRVKLTNEVLQGVRVLKLFAWRKPFEQKLNDKRDFELKQIYRSAIFSTVSTFLWGATPIFVTLATFAIYAAIPGNELTAARAFTSLSLFNILRFPLNAIPSTITRLVDISVVIKRLSKYMSAPESEVKDLNDLRNPEPNLVREPSSAYTPLEFDGFYRTEAAAAPGQVAVEVVNGDFAWPAPAADGDDGAAPSPDRAAAASSSAADAAAAAPTLGGLHLELRQGAFVGVMGPVGCGKTSVLMALIDEMPRVKGRVVVRGAVAFAAQEPWIQNATLRANVTFGRPFDQTLYDRVVHACALQADLAQLPGGDQCEIGERGINLSGGQKARIALARACYQPADVYLLDDVLSAVDAEVGAHLVRECITGLLKERGCLVVLVTHQTHWLHMCDHVVQMDDGGRVRTQGPPSGMPLPRGSNPSLTDLERAHVAGGKAAAAPAPADVRGSGGGKEVEGKTPTAAAANGGDATKPAAAAATSGAEARARTAGQLTKAEDRERGVVRRSVWTTYVRALGFTSVAWLVALYTLSQALTLGSSYWLTLWSADKFGQYSFGTSGFYIAVYAALSLSAAFLIWLRVVVVATATIRAGRRLHRAAISAVMGSPTSFFDVTPLGRILNRFSADLQVVDIQLRMTTQQFFLCAFQLLGILVLVITNSWFIIFGLAPLAVVYYYVARYYRHSSRELQRLDSISKSPIYAAFSEALNGCATIRAFGAASRFGDETCARFDWNVRASFVSAVANRWLGVRLECLGNIIVALSALLAIVTYQLAGASGSVDPAAAGMAGLTLSYALSLTDFLNWLIRVFTGLETQMVSVERLFHFCELPAEESKEAASRGAPPAEWPRQGSIVFDRVKLSYRPELPDVLREMSVTIRPGEKVGIVGRTGAGKSSLLVALFRIVELKAGSISIDGVDISSVPLETLRSRLSIIPQDPVLFSGTLRHNLDPLGQYSDAQLAAVLRQCSLAIPLDRPIDERGGNLSVGQRQLVCMGRALLKAARVLVLDEATASVDMETDALIQTTLQSQLGDATVLTIAHRLNTIMHADRVLVVHDGRLAEDGPPVELKNTPDSHFAKLWAARGE